MIAFNDNLLLVAIINDLDHYWECFPGLNFATLLLVLIRSLTGLNPGQIEKLRPTFKPALKTDQSSSVMVAPDKRQPKTATGKAPRLNSEDFLS